MSGFLIALAVLALLAVAFIGLCILVGSETPEARASRAQQKTEADIDDDHRAARRAMNDAAGQPWRNLGE